jgi:hypothetical protein
MLDVTAPRVRRTAMALRLGVLAAGVFAAAIPLACPPVAAADPVWPVAGAEDARATIDDLEAQGYDVQINWVSGIRTVPLHRCKVTAIHNPNHDPPTGDTFATVYVDVSCPNPDDDWGSGGFGIGF